VGQESVDLGIDCLSFSGELVSFTNPPSKIIPFEKALSFHQVSLGWHYLSPYQEVNKRIVEIGYNILDLYLKNKINCNIGEIIEFDDIKKYLILLKDGYVNGKIVVKLF
jgi:D-arabinose 1-dehydrogenase-like Zn-dependent alcohol dehydrogenase